MRSNRSLKNWYDLLNKKFFNGELTSNVCVQWGDEQDEYEDIDKYYGVADKGSDGYHDYIILLNRDKCSDALTMLTTMAHEMIHIFTGLKDDHGPAFERGRQMIADRGFFKKGAVRRGLTMF